MMKNTGYIAVEGPIGVGTTSLAGMLARHFDSEVLYEKVEDNPFLPRFYEDRDKNAFSTQLFFLVSRYRQLKQASQASLLTRRIITDYIMEKDHIFAELNLDPEELALYNELYRSLSGPLSKPDLVIFLTAQTQTLQKRVRKRGRGFESRITEKYIEEVNEAYHRFFFQYSGAPLLQVNTNEIDFVNNNEDFQKLLDKISSPIKGKEFFNPLGSV